MSANSATGGKRTGDAAETAADTCYVFGPFRLETAGRVLLRDGVRIALPARAFDTLVTLASRRGQVVDKDTLLRSVWPDAIVEENTLSQSIVALRKALGSDCVITVPGRGYALALPVRETGRETARRSVGLLRSLTVVAAAATLIAVSSYFWSGLRKPSFRFVPLTGAPGESVPTFSPDGRQVAFQALREGENFPSIYVKVIGAGEPLRIARGSSPSWSPDGQWIAFFGDPPGLYVVPPLGGTPRLLSRVSSPPAGVRAWSWFPDGKRLAIAADRLGNGSSSIVELSIESGIGNHLTTAPAQNRDVLPAVSPDGRTLAFVRIAHNGMTAIYTAPIPGGEARQLTRPENGATSPVWTNDSRELIYSATEYQGLAALFRVPADGGQARRITDAAYSALSADVARSGSRLAFTHHSEVHNLWRLDLDRPGALRRIAATTRRQDSPDFSPDGQSLLFNSTRSGPRQLWTSNAEGENLMQVTASSVFRTVGRARWSPDGSEIAFAAEQNLLDRDVYVIGARGGVHRAISPSPAHDMFPSFSRDGRWVYFTSDRGGLPQVWRAPRAGGTAVQVTRSVGLVPLESPDGRYVLYFNAPEREIWRIPTSGGAEEHVLSEVESYRLWTLAGNAILYLTRKGAGQQERWMIRRFDLASGTTADVSDVPKRPPSDAGALTATADGRTIIWAQVDEATNMIMLIENFR